jgi:tetratricopeptide (TPR) repeat protein
MRPRDTTKFAAAVIGRRWIKWLYPAGIPRWSLRELPHAETSYRRCGSCGDDRSLHTTPETWTRLTRGDCGPSGAEIVYRGEVTPYYTALLEPANEDELYLDLAQVRMDNNLEAGIARLTAALAKYRPKQSEFYSELGDAMRRSGRPGDAIATFEEALRLKPDSVAAWIGLGSAYEAGANIRKL